MNTFVYLAISGFLIWFIQSQRIFDYVFRNQFLKEIRACGICLGFWVCLFLFPAFNIIEYISVYQYIVFWVGLSAVSSMIIFLVKAGWQSKYGVTIIK